VEIHVRFGDETGMKGCAGSADPALLIHDETPPKSGASREDHLVTRRKFGMMLVAGAALATSAQMHPR